MNSAWRKRLRRFRPTWPPGFRFAPSELQSWRVRTPWSNGGSRPALQENERRDHVAMFAGQDVPGARGRGIVHHFHADTAFQEFGQHGLGRELLARAAAEQHHVRLQREDRLDLLRHERRDVGHAPVLDRAIAREDEAGGELTIHDRDRVRIRAAHEQEVFGAVEGEFHPAVTLDTVTGSACRQAGSGSGMTTSLWFYTGASAKRNERRQVARRRSAGTGVYTSVHEDAEHRRRARCRAQ